MFRVSLANAFAKRTLKPLHEKSSATPVAGTLAAAEVSAKLIYSGMVASRDSSGNFVICDGQTMVPAGLFALDCNATINDLDGQPTDISPFAIWQGGPDAYFMVDTPAFEALGTFAVGTIIYSGTSSTLGQITDDGGTDGVPIGRVVEVVSATRLIVQVTVPAAPGLKKNVTGFGDPS